ncbi:hypothetical protein M011DRAFT_251393 [Sporormia fimetaria CBS 119925]|uniref:Uncharacterized protein n=1 Tax=Sporormia fimetaria CBS 119925 TaxID=1340428 RepID=A0A6A6UYU1_9PLEO|nr:hypothetical protein M011DRAFT_251393 [Sporormia fimetaria CBS 119925]
MLPRWWDAAPMVASRRTDVLIRPMYADGTQRGVPFCVVAGALRSQRLASSRVKVFGHRESRRMGQGREWVYLLAAWSAVAVWTRPGDGDPGRARWERRWVWEREGGKRREGGGRLYVYEGARWRWWGSKFHYCWSLSPPWPANPVVPAAPLLL